MPQSKRLNLLFLIVNKNSETTENILRGISLQGSHLHIEKSSCMMQPSEIKSAGDRIFYSPTHIISPDSTQLLSCQMELNWTMPSLHPSDSLANQVQKLSSAIVSTPPTDAETQLMIASSDMLASNASEQAMEKNHAILIRELMQKLQPKYLRHNIWDDNVS